MKISCLLFGKRLQAFAQLNYSLLIWQNMMNYMYKTEHMIAKGGLM